VFLVLYVVTGLYSAIDYLYVQVGEGGGGVLWGVWRTRYYARPSSLNCYPPPGLPQLSHAGVADRRLAVHLDLHHGHRDVSGL